MRKRILLLEVVLMVVVGLCMLTGMPLLAEAVITIKSAVRWARSLGKAHR